MSQIYNQLSDDYNELFLQNIEEFSKKATSDKQYTAFYPSFGTKPGDKVDFLIYGQAVKGWTPNFFTEKQMVKEIFLKEAIEFSNCCLAGTSPLEWVNVHWSKSLYYKKVKTADEIKFYSGSDTNDLEPKCYNMHRSFFWNVCYKLMNKHYGFDMESDEWTTKMIWSNLYKIAPSVRTNPSNDECKWQEKLSIDLVMQELEEIKPKYCIVLTNDEWWVPFREKIGTKKNFVNEFIESVEEVDGTKFIVTKRPFNGSNNKYVDEIWNVIGIKCKRS